MKTRFNLALLFLMLAASNARSQPTTQPIAADQSTPRGAMKLFILAMDSGDETALRSLLIPANDQERRIVDSLIAQQKGIAEFQTAANAALGPNAGRRLIGNTQRGRNMAIAALPRWRETITGDTATIGDELESQDLVRRDGKWAFTVASMLGTVCGGTDPQSIDDSISEMNIRAKIFSETAAELRQGRYKTVAQVQRALESKDEPAQITKPTSMPRDDLPAAEKDLATFKSTLTGKTPEQLIGSFILLGSQKGGSYEYYYGYMANMAIRDELASRGDSAREALQKHANDKVRILEAINGPGDTVGRVCQQLLSNIPK